MNPIGAVQRWAIVTMALVIVGGAFGGWMRDRGYKAGETAGNAKVAALTARYAQATANAEAAARAKEEATAAAMVQIQQTYYQQGVTDANAKSNAIVAGLRVGALKLRHEWTCPATAGVSAPGASGSDTDAAADARAAGAADLVRLAAEYDARVRALQRLVKADRQ